MKIIKTKDVNKNDFDFIFACDGSSTRKEDGKFFGGWASILWSKEPNTIIPHHGGSDDTTVNRMELRGFVSSLMWLKDNYNGGRVLILLDSVYVMNGVNKYLPNWIKNNWVLSNMRPVLNKELWVVITGLLNQIDVSNIYFGKVKAHSKEDVNVWSEMNNIADVYTRIHGRPKYTDARNLNLQDLLILQ